MNRKEKLDNLVKIIDSLANLDEKFGIDKSNFKNLYESISNIQDDKQFNKAYLLALIEFSKIFEKLSKLGITISNIYKKTDEKIDTLEDEKVLKDIENKFNF